MYYRRSVYFYVIFNILVKLVTLHSQLLIICIIVANVEAKASSSIFGGISASTISLTCAHVFYNSASSNKLLKLTDLLSNKSPSLNPTQRDYRDTLWQFKQCANPL